MIVYVGQVLNDGVWETLVTDTDFDFVTYCLSYKAHYGKTKRAIEKGADEFAK